MAYQSLYRRYRPRRFGEIVGQQHVVTALRNSVRDDRTGHAYLFSGPRGTGKTTSARVLAKALNCTNLVDGEPCCECESCTAIEAGGSYDLHELDAASNNGVDAMRDLIAKASLGSPGRTKVYILDEVHMLSNAASNALLKTLEEPPPHVTFVLATTDPQKVLHTIRSRSQHFEFGLIPAAELEAHVRWVMQDAGIELDDGAVAYVLRKGAGSARDTLSTLDQVAALGSAASSSEPLDRLLDSLAGRDTGLAIAALADALAAGREPRLVGEELLGRLRDTFLLTVGAPAAQLPDTERGRLTDLGARMGAAAVTRALEAVGEALLEMRQAADPRIPLEVALVRLTRPVLDTSLSALVERVAALEAALAGGVAAAVNAAPASPSAPPGGPPPGSPPAGGPSVAAAVPPGDAASPPAGRGAAAEARRRLAARAGANEAGRGAAAAARSSEAAPSSTAARPPAPTSTPPTSTPPTSAPLADAPAAQAPQSAPLLDAAPGPAPAPSATTDGAPSEGAAGALPSVRELEERWDPDVLEVLNPGTRARFRVGRFCGVDEGAGVALFGLPNEIQLARCEERRLEVEAALASVLGRAVALRLVVDEGGPPGSGPELSGPSEVGGWRSGAGADPTTDAGADRNLAAALDDVYDDIGDIADLETANDAGGVLDRILSTFPDSEVVE